MANYQGTRGRQDKRTERSIHTIQGTPDVDGDATTSTLVRQSESRESWVPEKPGGIDHVPRPLATRSQQEGTGHQFGCNCLVFHDGVSIPRREVLSVQQSHWRVSRKALEDRKGTTVQFAGRNRVMRQDSPSVGRRVPRSSFERDRRAIRRSPSFGRSSLPRGADVGRCLSQDPVRPDLKSRGAGGAPRGRKLGAPGGFPHRAPARVATKFGKSCTFCLTSVHN